MIQSAIYKERIANTFRKDRSSLHVKKIYIFFFLETRYKFLVRGEFNKKEMLINVLLIYVTLLFCLFKARIYARFLF